ncbi:MAG: carbohydrate-binding domain-containing protein, partial [Holdemania filiformis]
MKRHDFAVLLGLSLILNGCSAAPSVSSTGITVSQEEATLIQLGDDQILINGQPAGETGAVQLSHDIVYYEAGQDVDYGEGNTEDEHSAEEAQAHTVITIREPGTYRVSGKLSAGQIAIDLGEEAKDDPNAVVNLILDQAEITCTVAPAIIVYNAYECAKEEALSTVDTQAAGFNLIVADGTENTVSGAYVARIYKEGTTKKLHKYDAAIESKVSLNLSGETAGTGTLTVEASNEGIETSMHMTINGGSWIIHSADDSLNANEDGVSVITINGGTVRCNAGGGQEGDGIDSNGWIVING